MATSIAKRSTSRSEAHRETAAFYGQHLAAELTLKHVKRLPSLVKDIAGTVDNALKSIEDRNITLPPSGNFPSVLGRKDHLASVSKRMTDELSVTDFFTKALQSSFVPLSL